MKFKIFENLEPLSEGSSTEKINFRDSTVQKKIYDKYKEVAKVPPKYAPGAYTYDTFEMWYDYMLSNGFIEKDFLVDEKEMNESSEYVATPQALDRDSIIQQLLDVSEEDKMQDCIFNKCDGMIKQYNIEANPDWDLSDILDTFDTKQLQELLQYVMDNCKNESLNEDVMECVGSLTEDAAPDNDSSTTELTIEVMSGLNADGFTAIITDKSSGKEIFRRQYYYGYDASYDRRWASSRAPYVTDIINDLKTKYNVDNVEVTAGKNVFRGDSMSSDSVEKFKKNYLSENTSTDLMDRYSREEELMDKLSGIVFRGTDYLDDYEEGPVEDIQMTDAQRLALQELDSCLECGEINKEEHAAGQNVQWDINFEDVVLFVAGIDFPLSDVKHVEYFAPDKEFDGGYCVTKTDGTSVKYGWYDSDMSGTLYHIDDFDEGIDNTIINESVSNVSWNDLYSYKYYFRVTPKYSPNPTYSDDCLQRANNCGCLLIRYQSYPGYNDVKLYVCKTPEDYDRFVSEINSSDILRDYARISNLSPFDFSVVENTLKNRFQDYIDNFMSGQRGERKLSAKGKKMLERSCPAVYVDNYSGEIRLPLPHDNMCPFNEDYDYSNRFNSGDLVKVLVNGRVGRVTRHITDDVVEVELDDGVNPIRLDRYYTNELELLS